MGGSSSTHFELSSDERAVLERLVDELRSGRMPAFATSTGERIPLPDDLRGPLRQLIEALLRGSSVVVLGSEDLLTTTEAARLLGVSRPYLVRLLDGGRIAYERVGSHRRVPVAEVLRYREERRRQREEGLRELQRMSQQFEVGATRGTRPSPQKCA